MVSTTLIAAPLQPRLSRPSDAIASEHLASEFGAIAHEREFKIESADSFIVRQSANRLLSERYGWRGYHAVSLPVNQTTNRTTLTAIEDNATIGTITVGLDDSAGMNCDDVFGDELDALRRSGQRLCEFTKLAIDPMTGNRRVLAALFHVAYIVAHRLRGRDTLVMEVNPRHVRYYERMLGCRVVGDVRINRTVDAPAVLLTVDFSHIMEQIGRFGGRPELSATERSLYPFAFSLTEEAAIISRLKDRYEHWLDNGPEKAPVAADSEFQPSDLMGM